MTNKQQIIEQFSQYLTDAPDSLGDKTDNPIDLYSVFAQLSVLKNEVKTESRQVKGALDEFKQVFASLNSNQSYLQQSIDSKQQQLEQQSGQMLKPLLLSLIEFYDRLIVAIEAANEPKPSGLLARFKLPLWQKVQTMKEGQQISLRQLQRVLDDNQIEPINALEQPYDATLMKVVATTVDCQKPNNWVVSESVKGFLWQGQLLRLAEVNVNTQEDRNE
jgi:molecular chaperone GrpE